MPIYRVFYGGDVWIEAESTPEAIEKFWQRLEGQPVKKEQLLWVNITEQRKAGEV